MLACCQYAWYNRSFITTVTDAATNVILVLNGNYSFSPQPVEPAFNESIDKDFECPLFGTQPGDPKSYLQRQCLYGYTGNLCAACIPGFYVDSVRICRPRA